MTTTGTDPRRRARLLAWLRAPCDPASLAAFRFLFGLLACAGAVRFVARGWVRTLYVLPRYHFTYYGFDWVRPASAPVLYAVFAVMALGALGVALGLYYRASAALFFATFTYVELLDKTTYLNHYYLVSVVALLLVFLPAGDALSLDARRAPARRRDHVPRWALLTLRGQVGAVYLFAAVAKLKPDWLLRGQPLGNWLYARSDLPVLGPWLARRWAGHAFSWAGLLFDLAAPFALSWARTRPVAYAAVVVFHALTAWLFPIGMFPWIMAASALVFFPPSWPRALAPRASPLRRAPDLGGVRPAPLTAAGAVGFAALALHAVVQLALPLRHYAYPGSVSWTEQGFRYAWHVMLVDRTGDAEFVVREPTTGRVWRVDPRAMLTPFQVQQMVTQPDMILQTAHWIARDFARRGVRDPEVRAEVFVALNGRRAQRLVDPAVDLARERDSLAPIRWLLPLAGP